jgi:hypothetical protein
MDESYNTVAERIIEFRNKYPEGCLRPVDIMHPYSIEIINGNPVFVVVAAAYRTPDDRLPGIGMAYEPIPGSTPYTRGSELQNAETAAWGRAIIAALAGDAKKGIASRDEVIVQEERVRIASGKPQAAVSRETKPDILEAFAAWYDAIEERKDDHKGLQALYNEAKNKGVPQPVLVAISTAGQKVAPK